VRRKPPAGGVSGPGCQLCPRAEQPRLTSPLRAIATLPDAAALVCAALTGDALPGAAPGLRGSTTSVLLGRGVLDWQPPVCAASISAAALGAAGSASAVLSASCALGLNDMHKHEK